ncbi:sigma-54-dependent Fis family transcriptional regulator [Aquincola sp. S2]|uniref:Sigma-54-dependent Fis family transcriptional regulator n=1 Tax=Pseudaquabacterium terrae TaxID=2732868 RepID=A0ABX2EBY6_9BURK|nr:sigma-54 dependent transcriptional regulator [Aquabacterium terrae]NRF66669.1 sigma-54-dependent Fis family transcriptional regulator [Aquabacterium terrae]
MPAPAAPSLLVVDDEPDLRTLYELTLLREGYDVETAGSVEEAWQRLVERGYNAVITDMRLPDGSGLDLLRRLEAADRSEKTIVITAYGSAENAVEALKAGAFDYLTKPVDLRQFRGVVAAALGRAPQTAPSVKPSSLPPATAPAAAPVAAVARAAPVAVAEPPAPGAHPALQRLIGGSAAMQQVRSMIERVARGMAPVMVQGESGTGKELVARAIHGVSGRSAQSFIAVNCSAIPEQLLEAEFFGYRKGAFTGANEDREGFFQAAHGGTLFLDEIGDLPLSMQSKLLRAIQERSVRPIGAVSEMPVNVRIVSATHKDLSTEVHEGRFRQDLYYRLNVIQLRMPPLRERTDDLTAICGAVLQRIARDAGVAPAPRLSAEALAHLRAYSFPGNVRELENLLHRAVTLAGNDVIERGDLGLDDNGEPVGDNEWVPTVAPAAEPPAPEPGRAAPVAAEPAPLPPDLVAYLDQIERDVLQRALERYRFNRTAAGASLGLSLRQMRYRMARLGINLSDHGE